MRDDEVINGFFLPDILIRHKRFVYAFTYFLIKSVFFSSYIFKTEILITRCFTFISFCKKLRLKVKVMLHPNLCKQNNILNVYIPKTKNLWQPNNKCYMFQDFFSFSCLYEQFDLISDFFFYGSRKTNVSCLLKIKCINLLTYLLPRQKK